MFFTKEGKPTSITVGGGAGIATYFGMKMLLDHGISSKSSTGFFNALNGISINIFSKISEKTGTKESNVVSITTGLIAGIILYHYYGNQRKNIGNMGDSLSVENANVGGDMTLGDKHTTTASSGGIAASGGSMVSQIGSLYGTSHTIFGGTFHVNSNESEKEEERLLFNLGHDYGVITVVNQKFSGNNDYRKKVEVVMKRYKNMCTNLNISPPEDSTNRCLYEHIESCIVARYSNKMDFFALGRTAFLFSTVKTNNLYNLRDTETLTYINEIENSAREVLSKYNYNNEDIKNIFLNIKMAEDSQIREIFLKALQNSTKLQYQLPLIEKNQF